MSKVVIHGFETSNNFKVRVALGFLTLIAGAFLITLMIRVRNQDDEPKFE